MTDMAREIKYWVTTFKSFLLGFGLTLGSILIASIGRFAV